MKNIQQRTDEAEYHASLFDIECAIKVTYDANKGEYFYAVTYKNEQYTSWRKVCLGEDVILSAHMPYETKVCTVNSPDFEFYRDSNGCSIA